MVRPLVLGHRGASGYLPENTIEAISLAFDQGSDGIECDLVPTQDGELIVRHENWLDGTTNVREVPEFATRAREGYSDGLTEQGFFSEDFSLAEIKRLRAVERIPKLRPQSARYDGSYLIPSVDELLSRDFLNQQVVVLEVKHGMHFTKQGIDVAGILAAKIQASNWQSRGIKLIIESFDFEMLTLLKRSCGNELKYVFLTEWERLAKGQNEISHDYLEQIASEFHGISVDIPMLFELDESGFPLRPNSVVDRANAVGLETYCWTLRSEDARGSVEDYFGLIASAGLDGIFVDQPDLLRGVVDRLA